MRKQISRREFIKLGILSTSALAFNSFPDWLPDEDVLEPVGIGRVTTDAIRIRKAPSYQGDKIGWLRRDKIISLLEEIHSPLGPTSNPKWYRIVGGFVHSGFVQPVEINLNKPEMEISEKGRLAEVTLPFVQSYVFSRKHRWQPLYRLYYKSVHWVTDTIKGPDRALWYQITDDLHRQNYYVPSTHLRLIHKKELTPISPYVPPGEKKIQISITGQTMTCYEKGIQVFQSIVSTGAGGPSNNNVSRDTPTGKFRITRKMPVRHMGNGDLTSDLSAYELPGVPWCCFFVSTGVAFHGTYWHNNYGRKMSSGCVNLRPDDAKWLYRWCNPIAKADDWYIDSVGTVVEVIM